MNFSYIIYRCVESLITEASIRMFDELLDTADDARGSGENGLNYNVLDALHEQLGVLADRSEMSEQRGQCPLVTDVLRIWIVTPAN